MDSELNLGNQISKYYKSFSGTDTLAFIMMPGSSPVVIGSLTTISYSMYRNKKPVINIGRTNINGVTRGSRIFAGTMIFTLINQHWLKELQEQLDWLKGYDELKVDELPLFDIMIVSANEYGNAVSMYIYGIDFTDEAQTISVEDLFTENVFSFIARDISNFKTINHKAQSVQKSKKKDKYADSSQHYFVLDSSSASLEDLAALEKNLTQAKMKLRNSVEKHYSLVRNLYHSSSNTMMGNDVAEIQELLNQTRLFQLPVNGVFDSTMDKAVREYQSKVNLDINGVVDDRLYNVLKNQVHASEVSLGLIVNKHGAFVYRDASFNSDIIDTKTYHEQIAIHEIVTNNDNDKFQRWYKIDTGYIPEEDVYSAYYTGNIIEFPRIEYNDIGAYVTLIQSALATIYPTYNVIDGIYGDDTQNQIKQLQRENGLLDTGIVDYNTWLILQMLSGSITQQVSNNNIEIEFTRMPGIYEVADANAFTEISQFNTKISSTNFVNVKVTVICHYTDAYSETMSKMFTVREEQAFNLETFSNAFVYNPKYGKTPYQVDYILYVYNNKPYKWTIKYT